MTATTPRTGRRSVVTVVGHAAQSVGRFAGRRYGQARGALGKDWALVAPAALGVGEYEAHANIPAIEASHATGDMIESSVGALAVSFSMTGALEGFGVDVTRPVVKRSIEGVSAAAGVAVDMAMGIHAPGGAEIMHPSVPTLGTFVVSALSSIAGSVAGYSSGRALTR